MLHVWVIHSYKTSLPDAELKNVANELCLSVYRNVNRIFFSFSMGKALALFKTGSRNRNQLLLFSCVTHRHWNSEFSFLFFKIDFAIIFIKSNKVKEWKDRHDAWTLIHSYCVMSTDAKFLIQKKYWKGTDSQKWIHKHWFRDIDSKNRFTSTNSCALIHNH